MAFPPSLRRRFEPLRELGAGALGRVWLARPLDKPGLPPVAVKVLREEFAGDPSFRARFTREVEAARRIRHPRVVPLLDGGFADGTPFMATPYFPGGSLRAALERGPLEPARVRRVAGQILEGLVALHRAGLVHRDVKPENVLVDQDGGAVVADLGLAQGGDLKTVTATGIIMGTPVFMAPEVCRGEPAGPAADLYALGCVIHELATGQEAWVGEPGEVFRAKAVDGRLPTRVRLVDPGLDALVEALLAPEPGARPDADRVAAALAGAADPAPGAPRAEQQTLVSGLGKTVPRPPRAPAGGRAGVPFWAPGLALVLGLGAGSFLGGRPGPGPARTEPVPAEAPAPAEAPPRLPEELVPLVRLRERARLAASSLAEAEGPGRRQLSLIDLATWDPGDAFLAPVSYFKVRWGTKAQVLDSADRDIEAAVAGLAAEAEELLPRARAWLEEVAGAAGPDSRTFADAVALIEGCRAVLFVLPDEARERVFPPAGRPPTTRDRLAGLAASRWIEEHPWSLGGKAPPDLRERRQALGREVALPLEQPPHPAEDVGVWVPCLDAYVQAAFRDGRDQGGAAVRLRSGLDAARRAGRRRDLAWAGLCLAGALHTDPELAGRLDPGDPGRLEAAAQALEAEFPGRPEVESLLGTLRLAGEALADPASAVQKAAGVVSLFRPGGIDGLLERGLVDQSEVADTLLELGRRDPFAQPLQPEFVPKEAELQALPRRLAEVLARNYPPGANPRKRYRLAAAALDAEPTPEERNGSRPAAADDGVDRRPTLLGHLLRLRMLSIRGAELAATDPARLRREAARALAWTSAAAWPRERLTAELWAIRGELGPGGDPERAARLARDCLDRLWIGREGPGYLAFPALAIPLGAALGEAILAGAPREPADAHRLHVTRTGAGSGDGRGPGPGP